MGIKRLTKLADGKAVTDAPLEEVLNRLAEYEGLDERGRLFRSPCAIGDTTWCVEERNPELHVEATHVEPYKPVKAVAFDVQGRVYIATDDEEIGYPLEPVGGMYSCLSEEDADRLMQEIRREETGGN